MRKNAAIIMLLTLVMLLIPAVPPVDAAAPVLSASGGTTAFVSADNTASTPVVVDAGITLSDPDSAELSSATISITAGTLHSTEDVLGFTNTGLATYGHISASYNGVTGVLTLTSTSAPSNVAQWRAALRAVTYTNTAVTPNIETRDVSFTVDDGTSASNTATKSVTVTTVDQSPIVSTTRGSVTTTGTPVVIDNAITVSDRDNTTQSIGTVSIGSGFQSGDVLAFTNNDSARFGNISASGSYNSTTGVLTLTSSGATAFNAQWEEALSAVTFASSSSVAGPRTISFIVTDGTKSSAAATDTVILVGAPGAPTGVSAAAGDREATISFVPPADDGGSAITGYTVTSNPGGLTATGTSNSITVTGLTNETAYTFTVTTTNANGTGPASTASNSVTPTVAASVASVSVPANGYYSEGQNLDFTVHFNKIVNVVSTNGTPTVPVVIGSVFRSALYESGTGTSDLLFRYTVQSGEIDTDGIALGANILLNGGTIRNAAGMDANLVLQNVDNMSGVFVRDVLGKPTNVSATAGNGEAVVSFTPPSSDGGSAITGYTVTSNPESITKTGTSSPITVTGLTNGTSYTFTVIVTNAAGKSATSAASPSVTPATLPGAPTGVTAVAGNGQATISFTPPASNGGNAIASYTVTSSSGGLTASGISSPITVTGLTNGTAYTFTVTATNSVGPGPASAASNSVTPATVPGAPTGVTAVAGNGEATISFTPPASNGGSAIASYTVTSSSGGVTATGTTSPITVTGLTNGTPYTFTVTATNSVGPGPTSAASNSVTPATLPGAPTGVTAVAGNGEATIRFTPPADGGSAIASYTVTSSSGGATATGTTSPITVTGLTNGTAYTFTVTATNSVGPGPASTASNSVTPATVPGAPTGVTAVAGNGEATISFTPPADGGSAIASYTVTSSSGGATATGTSSPITVTGLANGTSYTFTVTATNSEGTGPTSAASNSVTPVAPSPSAPASTRLLIDLNGALLDPNTIDLTKPSVTLDVAPKNGVAYVTLPATILNGMAGQKADFFLEIKAPYGSYRVPVNLISLIPRLSELLAANGLSPDDIGIKITLTDKSGDASILSALASGLPNGKVLGNPVDFGIQIVRMQNGQTVGDAESFSEAIVRLIPMPGGVTAMPQHWGAFRYNETIGDFEFIPARAVLIDGVWYAAISSWTNSVYVVADNAISFTDIPDEHWARVAVDAAAAKGLIQGVGNGRYAPSQSVSRAEFAAMLVRALGRGASSGSAVDTAPFADVKPGAWYYSAVAQAKALGLLSFAGDGSFMPDRPLTREEMASMLAAAVALERPQMAPASADLEAYKDIGGVDADTLADIRLMVQLGIMTGTSADSFDPQGETTRAQAAVVFVRTLRTLDLID